MTQVLSELEEKMENLEIIDGLVLEPKQLFAESFIAENKDEIPPVSIAARCKLIL